MGAAEYYLSAKLDADGHIIPIGRLQDMLAETTGLAYFYNGIHTDALQTRKWLEILQEGTKSEKYVWYTTNPDAKIEYGKLTATEVNNHIKADDSVQLLADMIRVIANRQHMLEDVRESFVNRSIMLSKIVDMRVAGLEEVWVNGTRETRND
jgi:predicted transglutaminase-like cysteine proteinase